jgi:subtilisin family serine protease
VDPLELVRLPALMALTSGGPDPLLGLVDGPVALGHPDLAASNIQTLAGMPAGCRDSASMPCRHGTSVAGVLAARRGSPAPAIAPGCTLLVRPIFLEASLEEGPPSVSSGELAQAIMDCVDAGARVVNVSAALTGGSIGTQQQLHEALEQCVRRRVLVVAAAGNQGAVAGSVLTRHPWVIPVVGYGPTGWPLALSNLGHSVGRGGVGAPGVGVVSLAPDGGLAVSTGTSIAAPFVTGVAALLWSLFPGATAGDVKHALLSSTSRQRKAVTPPLLDAFGAYQMLAARPVRRVVP